MMIRVPEAMNREQLLQELIWLDAERKRALTDYEDRLHELVLYEERVFANIYKLNDAERSEDIAARDKVKLTSCGRLVCPPTNDCRVCR